jgi:hypothetical protein
MPTSDEMLEYFLEDARTGADDFTVGEDISPIPELKIIFDGFGEDEDTGEEDRHKESYALFIHKDALEKEFVFPQHDNAPWALIHRPDQEICLSAWYDASENYWTLPDDWNDSINSDGLTVELFEDILSKLYEKYTA